MSWSATATSRDGTPSIDHHVHGHRPRGRPARPWPSPDVPCPGAPGVANPGDRHRQFGGEPRVWPVGRAAQPAGAGGSGSPIQDGTRGRQTSSPGRPASTSPRCRSLAVVSATSADRRRSGSTTTVASAVRSVRPSSRAEDDRRRRRPSTDSRALASGLREPASGRRRGRRRASSVTGPAIPGPLGSASVPESWMSDVGADHSNPAWPGELAGEPARSLGRTGGWWRAPGRPGPPRSRRQTRSIGRQAVDRQADQPLGLAPGTRSASRI